VAIERITPERFHAAWQLRLRYRDKPRISFTDLTSFVVMKEMRLISVISGDAHFEHAGLGFRRIP
jgi:predicted nucleic acid-binding protein